MDIAKQPDRCEWGNSDPIYVSYHDEEWGVPLHDDRKIFEFLCLEGAQAGLNWLMILKKRENYRKAFANFDASKVARFSENKIERLLQDPGIVRNRLKVNAFIQNARAFLQVQEEFGSFDSFIWRFVDGKPIRNRWRSMSEIPASSPVSDLMSKDLKQRGFKFVGSTICYAHMQAAGMVNDHVVSCFRFKELSKNG